VEALFLFVGVERIFSAEDTLSLSVTVIYVDIKESDWPNPFPPLARPDLFPSCYYYCWTSWLLL